MKRPQPQTHQFGTPKAPTPKNWDLVYRGQVLTSNVPYAICVAARNKHLQTGCFTKEAFTIKPH